MTEHSIFKGFTSIILVILLGLAVSACGSLLGAGGDKNPPRIFDLTPEETPAAEAGLNSPSVVARVSATEAIDTAKIVIRRDGREILYLADSRWSDKASRMIGRYLIVNLGDRTPFLVLTRQSVPLQPTYRLDVDIRDFSAHTGPAGPPVVRIALAASLFRVSPPGLAGQKEFSATASAVADSHDEIVRAFGEALEAASLDLADWLATFPAEAAENLFPSGQD